MSDPETNPTPTPSRPYGIEGVDEYVWKEPADGYTICHLAPIGQWIDGLIAADPTNVQHPDAATEVLSIADKQWQGLYCDHLGLQNYTDILAVRRIDLTQLGAVAGDFGVLRLRTFDVTLKMLDGTKFGTRLDNMIQGFPIGEAQIGDPVCWSLRGWQKMGGTKATETLVEVQRMRTNVVPLPRIMTVNWGELSLSRQDLRLFMQVMSDYPENFDMSDYDVLMWAENVNVEYSYVQEKEDITSTYTPQYMYWIDTAKGNFISIYCWIYGDVPLNTFDAPHLSNVAEMMKAKRPEEFQDASQLLNDNKLKSVNKLTVPPFLQDRKPDEQA